MERHRETVELPAARIEVERVGSGPPLVLLQSAEAYEAGSISWTGWPGTA